jgi:hypothetical protein
VISGTPTDMTDARAEVCSVGCPVGVDPYHNVVSDEQCTDGVDNNGDGLVDGDDPKCPIA